MSWLVVNEYEWENYELSYCWVSSQWGELPVSKWAMSCIVSGWARVSSGLKCWPSDYASMCVWICVLCSQSGMAARGVWQVVACWNKCLSCMSYALLHFVSPIPMIHCWRRLNCQWLGVLFYSLCASQGETQSSVTMFWNYKTQVTTLSQHGATWARKNWCLLRVAICCVQCRASSNM